MNNYILTCALPYANGNLHIGHFFEATAADIKARYFKFIKKPYVFVSGDDCHGAATTLYCHKNNLDIETHLQKQFLAHVESYKDLKIEFTNFSRTNKKVHHTVVNWCIENILDYEKLNAVKILETKEVFSWFDRSTEQFLPDRYVKGTCPHCGALEQNPEVCEACNKHILAHELISPVSVLSRESVGLKKTRHLTLNTDNFYEEIERQSNLLHHSIKNKILDSSLEQQKYIDISRDSPYYGIEIDKKYFPDLDQQFFYVWFDAPIGYLSFAFEFWLKDKEATKELFDEFLLNLQLEHFIGKDIAYFHTFLWINLLKVISHNAKLEQINFHGWLTLNETKFSKSKGHQFDLSNLSSSQIDALRLYFFSKHDGSIQDTEFAEKEVYDFYNQSVVNGVANFYARSIKIVQKNDLQKDLKINFSTTISDKYASFIEQGNYKKLYELLQFELSELNSEFQASALWKETHKEIILSECEQFLSRWYEIYQIFSLVCPGLKDKETQIKNYEFIHIAQKLEPFSII